MRSWRPKNLPQESEEEPVQSGHDRRDAGYYASEDPYGNALDDFDRKFDWQPYDEEGEPATEKRFWQFWKRDTGAGNGADADPEYDYLPDYDGHEPEEVPWDEQTSSEPYEPAPSTDPAPQQVPYDAPEYAPHYPPPPKRRFWKSRKWVWASRGFAACLLLFFLTIGWLIFTAPLNKSLEPIAAPQTTLLASDGTPIARSGASVEAPVEVAELPDHVVEPFLAIEDRRFYSHLGVDPRGIARAAWTGVGGGSTITQQLAKFTFLTPDQTLSRKAREALIAFWLEFWLSKDEILERYLSNAYFGDNQYGLRAASLHYFYRQPENLKPHQAAMLAGLLKAPSRLAPSKNYELAHKRMKLVVGAMVDAGYITQKEADAMRAPKLDVRATNDLPNGTYFADWALGIAQRDVETGYAKQTLTTTLDSQLQRLANRVINRAPLGNAQVALVAMRPSGEVVAMLGGRNYRKSPFNRATQAKRQPGSTFKLFTYAAALNAGWDADDTIANTPIEEGDYRPRNYGGRYSDQMTLEEAFASSSNVAAVRLFNEIGSKRVIDQARDMGITSKLAAGDSSLALGTSSVTLLELTAAYAGIAANTYPIKPHAFEEAEDGWLDWFFDGERSLSSGDHKDMEQMLRRAINKGTGRAAVLRIPNFGKTGTSQNNRDALFVGYAGDLVVGVWVGNDDNSPLDGVTGGGLPAQIWRDFMVGAIAEARAPAKPKRKPDPKGPVERIDIEPVVLGDNTELDVEDGEVRVDTEIGGMPVGIRVGEDGLEIIPPGESSSDNQPADAPAAAPAN